MLLVIVLYLTEMPTAEELLAENSKEHAIADKSLDSSISSTVSDWSQFLRASWRMPLYAMPAATFVFFVGLLNILAYYVRSAPLTRQHWDYHYQRLSRSFSDPRWIRDFFLDVRPLFLSWLLLVPPITIMRMIIHTICTAARPLLPQKQSNKAFGMECMRFTQYRIMAAQNTQMTNYYTSPWFAPALILPYLLGVPAAISLWIYWRSGVDAALGYPSHEVGFFTVFVIIGLYLSGLGWCLSTLFFRSYFTYPLNFWSTEYDVEIYDDLIQTLPVKGWFFDFCTMRWHVAKKILWTDVVSVKFSGGVLKTDFSKTELPIIALLKKLTSVYESIASKLDIHTESLEIVSKHGSSLSINLWELSSDQKLRLFRLLRKNAPSIFLNEDVQHALTGSTVLRAPKYTEIWFSVLKGDSTILLEGDLTSGHVLRQGQYRVKSKLASGGQAVVYSAVDQNNQTVVLKEFQLTTGESLGVQIESAKDFENESAILDQLSHPSIVKSHDVFYEEGRVYLVLENVEGESLRELVSAQGPRSYSEIVSIARQMCDVLKYLHTQEPPVVHRDFTPDNIILQPDGKLKLIDFSVAQRKNDGLPSDCAGKHAYTPPEQFRGAACPQSDIYALGATLYFLSTGVDPVPISRSDLPASESELSGSLSQIIANATELDLKKRYESIDWIDLALQTMVAEQNTAAGKVALVDNADVIKPEQSNVVFINTIYHCGIISVKPEHNAKPEMIAHLAKSKLRRKLI